MLYKSLSDRYINLIFDSTGTVFRGKVHGGWGKTGYQKFKDCMSMYEITTTEVHIEDSYSALQKLSGTTRACLRLGRKK